MLSCSQMREKRVQNAMKAIDKKKIQTFFFRGTFGRSEDESLMNCLPLLGADVTTPSPYLGSTSAASLFHSLFFIINIFILLTYRTVACI